jgi:hypothetical protein
VLIALLALGSVALAGEPALLDLAMPETKIVFGINIARIVASPLGQSVASQLESSNPDIAKMVKSSGFDPTRDLQEILIAAVGGDKDAPGIALVRGNFDAARIEALAQGQGAKTVEYQGVKIYVDPPKGIKGAVAFLDGTTMLAGSMEEVQKAIARRQGGGGLEAKLAAKVGALRDNYDAWGISAVPVTSLAATVPNDSARGMMQGDVFKSIETFSGGVKVTKDLDLSVEVATHTEKDAAALGDVVRFLAGMLKLDEKNQKGVAANFAMTVEGNAVKLSVNVPEAELRKQMQAFQAGLKKGGNTPAPMLPKAPAGGVVIQSSPKDMGTVVIPGEKQQEKPRAVGPIVTVPPQQP